MRGRKGMDRPLWDCNRRGGKGDQMGSGYLFRQILEKKGDRNVAYDKEM